MSSVRQAFDRHASVYDQVFSSTQIRSEVWEVADRVFVPGGRILDLGCGTGEDAIHFAARSLNVTAIDVSPQMIIQAMAKAGGRVQCQVADMQTYSPQDVRFDGIFSNFGALNCSPDLDWLGNLARPSLNPGAHLVLTTMGQFYPLESAVFLLKLQPRLALRRLGRPATAVIEGVRVDVYYHSVRTIANALGPGFKLKSLTGVRCPQIPGILKPFDRWISANRLTATWSDHFVSVWEREA